MRIREHAYRSSFGLDTVEVALADGRELRLVRKSLSRSSLDANARLAKDAAWHDPRRELEVYTRLLAGRDLGTAEFYGASGDWLFLEDVPGVPLWQCERPAWEAAARWLARLHAEVPARGDSLLRYDDVFARLAAPAPLAAQYERALAELRGRRAAFVHGDFFPSNVLVDGARICPIDWEMAGVGPALLDLASLVAGWPEDDVSLLARAYRGREPDDAFMRELDCCRLLVAVRLLALPRRWSPPAEHARDWTGEARRLAERLER
jgi:hypothetical protein